MHDSARMSGVSALARMATADFPPFPAPLATQFDVVRPLGAGGMGAVWLVRDRMLDRLVALKVLLGARTGADERERFLREARTAARLVHPHIVPIFRADESDGTTWFTMGFVEGESLGDRLRDRGTLAPADVVRILREAAWALAYAHARGVVHRDVKPDNLLLDRESGRTLVTDFGIARDLAVVDSRLTADGNVLGTVHYMSPEQAAGEALDGRSDVYALGVIGYQALSGTLPFDGAPQHVLVAHVTRQAPSLASVAPHVPAALVGVIDRCLAKDPAQRWQSAESLAAALDDALAAAQEAEHAAAVAAPGAVLSEAEAMAIWQRAAQLQAEAAHRMERTVTLQKQAPAGADPRANAPTGAFLAREVEAAAVEAGISRQYVAIALAERQGAGASAPLVVGDVEDRRVTTMLGVTQRGVNVSRLIAASPREVLETLGRVATGAPFHLSLDEVVGGHPLDGGILRFRIPGVMAMATRMNTSGMLPALCYRAAQVDLEVLNVTLAARGTPERPQTEIVISGDLREGQRKNVRSSRVTMGTTGGIVGTGAGMLVGLGEQSMLLALFPALVIGAGAAAAAFGLFRWSYRRALTKLTEELEALLRAVQRTLDETNIFGGPTTPSLVVPVRRAQSDMDALRPASASLRGSKLGLINDALERRQS
mgnify:CR=1 FL=1